ncbi:MAG TPA: YihY/virulence factor BrkB family protein [Thermoanaerobaculia bacterium]|nr:YihY/virulence factor BrkB family protein [Thermoanaerobaculia bacterium]
MDLLSRQLGDLAATSPATLGWGALLWVLLALWIAAKGAKALIGGVNIAYNEEERRGFVRVQGVSLLFTLGAVVFLTVSLTLIAVVPRVVEGLPLPAAGFVIAFVLRWVLLLALILVALAVIYRFASSRTEPRWTWLGLGSIVAAGLWMIASILFSYYAETFGSFNETYGTIAGAVVALLWLQISALAILVGAELNAEIEHQTAVDTTEGPEEPMGRRGAVKADTLPEDAPAEE